MIDLKSPVYPESITEGTIAKWHKQPGETFAKDDILVEVETDKIVLEIAAPCDGELKEILYPEGDTVAGETVLGRISEQKNASGTSTPAKPEKAREPDTELQKIKSRTSDDHDVATDDVPKSSPSARQLAGKQGLDLRQVSTSQKHQIIGKEDVLRAMAQQTPDQNSVTVRSERSEKRVAMSRLRARIAERLMQAQHHTATLTTFNEVNMQPLMTLRTRYKEKFEQMHQGVRLGFMSFFVRACVEALRRFPSVNASIDGQDVVYHGYQDIGVAVSSPRGLVVPVLRSAEQLTFAAVEQKIRELGIKARDNKLTIEELQGGTFTISNGGVFGSLLSTPILNPPQTAILGMHKIQDRVVVEDSNMVIRPMMYLALSYDHRMIDGREAVQFLVTIKELIEDPMRILLEV